MDAPNGKPSKSPRLPPFTPLPRSISRRMDEMSAACLRVAICVADETLGWQRRRAKITVRQFRAATGMSERGVTTGIAEALRLKIIVRRPIRAARPQAGFLYRIPYKVRDIHKERLSIMREEEKNSVQWRHGESESVPSDPDELSIARRQSAKRYRRRV